MTGIARPLSYAVTCGDYRAEAAQLNALHGNRTVTRREAGGRRPGDPFPIREITKKPERVGMARRGSERTRLWSEDAVRPPPAVSPYDSRVGHSRICREAVQTS